VAEQSVGISQAQIAVSMIDLAVVKEELRTARTRRYIGASGIGNPCDAYQALSMRGFPSNTPDPQLIRIFREGHRIEAMVVSDLKAAGHLVAEVDPMTGKQWHFSACGGHFAANLDGSIHLAGNGESMTLEIKSMNRALFRKFVKYGVLISHKDYYDQVIAGLGLAINAGIPVSKCFFVAYCKDNSMYHAEIVEFDAAYFDTIKKRVGRIVLGASMRASPYPKAYDCTVCFKRTSCWEPNVIDRDCSHCKHSSPTTGHQFKCNLGAPGPAMGCSAFQLWRPEKHV
jgi:hypothetical protein